MNKQLKGFINLQKKITNSLNGNNNHNEIDLLSVFYELKTLIEDKNQFLTSYTFSSDKKEQLFFKKHMKELYANYWFYSELSKIYISLPIMAHEVKPYFLEKVTSLTKFKEQYLLEYAKYCGNGYENDTEIYQKNVWKTHFDSPIPSFMDKQYPHLFPAYFLALERLSTFLLDRINTITTQEETQTNSAITWAGNKTDFATLVYGLHLTNTLGGNKISVQKIADCLSPVFNLQLNSSVSKTISDAKQRKSPKSTIFNEMQTKFEEFCNNQ